MAVTMKEIAEITGVSKATVSKIINGRDRYISEETRKKVLGCITQMGYVPNAMARGLKVKKTRMIGFILPDISNPFFPEIAKGIEDKAKKEGFGVVICNTDDRAEAEYQSFQFLFAQQVDGIIFTRALRRANMDKVFESGIPIVVVDREVNTKQLGFGQIFIDTRQGIKESTNLLIQAGCEKIAYISAQYHSEYDRYSGYVEAMQEAGRQVQAELVYKNQYNVDTGYEGINKILETNKVDGVVCGNDLIAIGVIRALSERGIKIPDQVKIMGFDDMYFSQYMVPPLSTIKQPAYEMGAQAAEMLIDNILYQKPLAKKKLNFTICMRGTV
ncbi:LacI family transcriptional regulator [Clostridiales bacterium COT073_COT-073]|nr:LacI family transcriptional regulator [Clostridiales bacterium COT073_COT-073]